MRWISVVLAAVAVAAVACGGGGDDDDSTPTRPVPTSDATVAATVPAIPTPSGEIRSIDLQSEPDVAELLTETGGEYVQDDVLYADLTGDGIEEAIVPVSSGGTLGSVAFIVLTPTGDSTFTLLVQQPTDTKGLAIGIEGSNLVQLEPVFGPDDPECCPSMLRKTIYGWNGDALAIESVETEENPGSGSP